MRSGPVPSAHRWTRRRQRKRSGGAGRAGASTGSGGHIISSSAIYGGTANLFLHTLPRFGITTTFVDPRDHDAMEAAITGDTRLIHGETIGNPTMPVLDIPAISEIAHRHGIPLMVDSTFASPALCRPIEWGADIVMHSATKFISGHGTVIGGVERLLTVAQEQQRLRIAMEAARHMSDSGISDYQLAKRKACQQLGVVDTRNLPSNQEIKHALLLLIPTAGFPAFMKSYAMLKSIK